MGKPLSTFKHQPPIPALLSILKPRIASLPLIGARVCPKPTATPAPLPSSTSLSKAELLALAKAYVEKKGAGAGGEEEALLAPDFMYVCVCWRRGSWWMTCDVCAWIRALLVPPTDPSTPHIDQQPLLPPQLTRSPTNNQH